MRVLFLADLHIMLKKNIPIEWQYARYTILVQNLKHIIKDNNIDKVIFGGDTFDKLPTLLEFAILTSILQEINIPCIIFSGNHEMLNKRKSFIDYLDGLISNLEVINKYSTIENFDILPYEKLHSGWYPSGNKLLFTHVRGAIEPHVKPEIDLNVFNDYELVIAGDLHSHSNSQRNIVYPGSPMTLTFTKKEVKGHGVIVLDTETLVWKHIELKLPQMLKLDITEKESITNTNLNYIKYTMLNKSDNKEVESNNSKSIRSALINEMGIREELLFYLEEAYKNDKSISNEVVDLFTNLGFNQ